MIKAWLFEFFPGYGTAGSPEMDFNPQLTQKRFQDYLDLWRRDEALGFEGIFFSEHHFGQAYSPSPNLLIAHLAAQTTTLRLGVLGTVSPYATPWRVLEEFAMLDHLSQGRVEMGMVSGIPPELSLVGISVQEMLERHAETMQVMQKARTDRLLSHEGKHWNFSNLNLQPRMYQAEPAMWTSAISTGSAERAGANGWKLCSGFHSVAALNEIFGAYRAGARANGRAVGPDDLAIRRQVAFVEREEDREEALIKAREFFKKAIFDQADPAMAPPISEEEFIVGTPSQVVDEIIRQCRELECGNMLFGAMANEFEDLIRCHETFGNEVIPALREAKVGAPALVSG